MLCSVMPGQSDVILSLENTIKRFAMGEELFCRNCDNIIRTVIYINAYDLHMQMEASRLCPQ